MRLNSYAAGLRLAILEDLQAGRAPRSGEVDPALLAHARTKGVPQAGTTRYAPDALVLEFVFPDPKGAAVVVPVRVAAPERIVFLPVPPWVVEQIWEGEVGGSFEFESDARRMLAEFEAGLAPGANDALFGPAAPKRRG